MKTLIVAGVPRPLFDRNRNYAPAVDGWLVSVNPAVGRVADLKTCWDAVLREVFREASAYLPHVAATHHDFNERRSFEQSAYLKFRLIWIEPRELSSYGTPRFTEMIQRIAAFEAEWSDYLQPRDAKNPALLPEGTFDPASKVADLWRRVQRVSPGSTDTLDRVRGVRRLFEREHRVKAGWLDQRSLVFAHDGPYHGTPVDRERRWKYGYRLPDAFHFDVRHVGGRAFMLKDHRTESVRFKRYANVDPYGHLRGGE